MTGSTERWRRVDELLEGALELPTERRQAFLDAACGPDTALRREVEELLGLEARMGGFMEPGEAGIPTGVIREVAGELGIGGPGKGSSIGRYRILDVLGRGGMSTVYLAERADGQFERTVALKVLRSDIASDELAARVRAERQILASLSHANVAGVLDGGVTEDGRPYLVMEVVRGEPLDRYADERRLTIQGRLELFRQVAEAVAYAHRNLVVHRDLKPSNILVTPEGRPKLLDFGIAKLVDPATSGTPDTRPATRWMTLEYAAPEQILGRPVTTATDVHGLGVVLYELLSGRRPFGGSTTAYALEKSICEDVPERPSVAVGRTEPGRYGEPSHRTPDVIARARSTELDGLRRELEGDLDAIVLRCLRKEPAERYPSVDAFLADLERHGSGRPVEAREGAWPYRARKFVGRHRVGVASGATIALLLVGGAVALSFQQAATARERDRANEAAATAAREAENARLVTQFLADVFRGRDPTDAPADTLSARELLAWGTGRVESEFQDRPEVQAELLTVMANAHSNLGLYEESVALHERSVELRRSVFGARHVRVAEGLADLLSAHRRNRDFEAALPVSAEILEIRRKIHGPDDPEVAAAVAGLGLVLRDVGRADTAEVLLREALDLMGRTNGRESEQYVDGQLGLAYVLRAQGRLEEAEALYREALPRKRELARGDGQALAVELNNFAFLLTTKGDYSGAVPLYRESLDVTRRLYGRGHPSTLLVAQNLAGVLSRMEAWAEAVAIQRESTAAAEAHWPEGHWRVGQQLGVLGRVLLMSGDPVAAEDALEARIRSYEETLGEDHDWTSFARADLAVAWILQGREAQGRAVIERMYRGLEVRRSEAGGVLSRGDATSIEPLVFLLDSVGLPEDALRFRGLVTGDPGG